MPSASYRKQQQDTSNRIRLGIIIFLGIVIALIVFLVTQNKPAPLPDYPFPAREMGNTNAKVVVEEFSDYQCPYCGKFATLIQPILKSRYIDTGKIRFVYRSMAFVDTFVENSTESHDAAFSAFCAGDQNKFWEYHDLLFQNQKPENTGNLSRPNLISFAMQLNLDSVAFDQCLTSKKYAALLQSDVDRADRLGINSTPSFVINTKLVNISQDMQTDLFSAIDRAVAAAGGSS